MQTPVHTPAEARTRSTFLAMMWALSRPGVVFELQEDCHTYPENFMAVAETVLDLESSFYTEDHTLYDYCIRTTARQETIEEAEYVFIPTVTQHELGLIENISRGTMIYPDRAATLICGCGIGSGASLTLSGPGIETTQSLQLDQLPAEFWAVRERAIHYPLGWDVIFIDGGHVAGIPRTSRVEIHS